MSSLAHRDAFFLGFLHCDISSGNILITDDKRYDGGLLIDWDLCENKNTLGKRGARASRTVRGVIPG